MEKVIKKKMKERDQNCESDIDGASRHCFFSTFGSHRISKEECSSLLLLSPLHVLTAKAKQGPGQDQQSSIVRDIKYTSKTELERARINCSSVYPAVLLVASKILSNRLTLLLNQFLNYI